MTYATEERRIICGLALLATLAAGLIASSGLHVLQAAGLVAPHPINNA